MGTDDRFRKLKEKQKTQRKRASAKRESYEKFLIVCEDTVSGYHYLKDVIKHFKLSTANVSIVGLGQSPISIVEHANHRFTDEKKSYRPDFDKVFCVFDRDTHSTFFEAKQKIEAINKKLKKPIFNAIPSDPCFEIWLIIHFKYTSKLYEKSGRKSAANMVVEELRMLLPNYQKGYKEAFQDTCVLMAKAIENSKKLKDYCEKNGTESPRTDIDIMIEYIIDQHESMNTK